MRRSDPPVASSMETSSFSSMSWWVGPDINSDGGTEGVHSTIFCIFNLNAKQIYIWKKEAVKSYFDLLKKVLLYHTSICASERQSQHTISNLSYSPVSLLFYMCKQIFICDTDFLLLIVAFKTAGSISLKPRRVCKWSQGGNKKEPTIPSTVPGNVCFNRSRSSCL